MPPDSGSSTCRPEITIPHDEDHIRRVDTQTILWGSANGQPLGHIVVHDLLVGRVIALKADIMQRAGITDAIQFGYSILHAHQVEVTVAEIDP